MTDPGKSSLRAKLQDWTGELATVAKGGFAALVALLAFLGLKSNDAMDRVLRNYPVQSIVIGMLLGVGVAAATIALALKSTRFRRTWAVVGFVAVATALASALVLGVVSKDTTERPTVKAGLSVDEHGNQVVTYSASATGLKREEFLDVEVEGLASSAPVYEQVTGRFGSRADHMEAPPTKVNALDPTEEYVSRLAYRFTGGDFEGNAVVESTYTLPPGVYERVRVYAVVVTSSKELPVSTGVKRCAVGDNSRGCVAIALPPPQLAPTLRPTSSKRGVTSVEAGAVDLRTTQRLELRLVRVKGSTESRTTSLATPPDSYGQASLTMRVPRPPRGSSLCVVASLTETSFDVPPPPPPEGGDSSSSSGQAGPQANASPGDSGANGGPGRSDCSAAESETMLVLRR
jgi:hypothetical protein